MPRRTRPKAATAAWRRFPTIEEEDAKTAQSRALKSSSAIVRASLNRMNVDAVHASGDPRIQAHFYVRPMKQLGELRDRRRTLLLRIRVRSFVRDMTAASYRARAAKEIEHSGCASSRRRLPTKKGPHAMVGLIARVTGIGIETADMLVNEILSRHLRDSKAVRPLRWPHRLTGRKRQATT